ncbi:hypothetical protein A3D88_02825 [Candidatus Peribacteria bacterium RIFCSPHIGHO2_02_FULL_52_16]|nr:MAG: hypothetical protein A2706_00655 [Candidatus Peribacteria bacterium RIFCSPHIGHO2_01_FULL_51_35]OGJ61691.1 MAG: hypothetical protein A3D88_02825 [Candidatus Peribacteria bacterium RIFCSPHIGHO2_02_FULL_52_16]
METKRPVHSPLKQPMHQEFLLGKGIAKSRKISYNSKKYTSIPIRITNILQRRFPKLALCRRMLATAVAASLLLWAFPQTGAASSFDPTLLVNTESFQIIDEGDSTTDIEIRFGDTVNEKVYWNRGPARFQFTDDVHSEGNITGSGTLTVDSNVKTKADLTINSDSGAADAVLTFGSDGADQTFKFLNAEDRFEFDDDTNVVGNLTASGNLIASGFGKVKGDLTLNSDSGAADAILTFGSDTADQTLKFLNAEDRFEVDDDFKATGNLLSSGGLVIDSAAVFKSTLKLNGVTYTFPFSDGTASGKVLKTNSAGQLSWSTDATSTSYSRSSGSISLSPDYAGAVYVSSGAATVGSLGLRYDSGSAVNFYRWQSTRTTNQQYWIVSRVRIPEQFTGWEAAKPIEFRYRASGAWLEVRALDTNNNNIALTGHTNLKATTWTTATITGPEVSGTFASGSYMTIMVKMVSSGALVPDRAYADASFINLNIDLK